MDRNRCLQRNNEQLIQFLKDNYIPHPRSSNRDDLVSLCKDVVDCTSLSPKEKLLILSNKYKNLDIPREAEIINNMCEIVSKKNERKKLSELNKQISAIQFIEGPIGISIFKYDGKMFYFFGEAHIDTLMAGCYTKSPININVLSYIDPSVRQLKFFGDDYRYFTIEALLFLWFNNAYLRKKNIDFFLERPFLDEHLRSGTQDQIRSGGGLFRILNLYQECLYPDKKMCDMLPFVRMHAIDYRQSAWNPFAMIRKKLKLVYEEGLNVSSINKLLSWDQIEKTYNLLKNAKRIFYETLMSDKYDEYVKNNFVIKLRNEKLTFKNIEINGKICVVSRLRAQLLKLKKNKNPELYNLLIQYAMNTYAECVDTYEKEANKRLSLYIALLSKDVGPEAFKSRYYSFDRFGNYINNLEVLLLLLSLEDIHFDFYEYELKQFFQLLIDLESLYMDVPTIARMLAFDNERPHRTVIAYVGDAHRTRWITFFEKYLKAQKIYEHTLGKDDSELPKACIKVPPQVKQELLHDSFWNNLQQRDLPPPPPL